MLNFHNITTLITLAVCTLWIAPISHASRVIINAEASIDYENKRSSGSKDAPITYHFIKGQFFKGYVNDKSLTDVTFLEIAEDLAVHLAKQNYVPTANAEDNDVMLLVNWGVTAVEESFEDIMGITSIEEYDELYGSPTASESEDGDTSTTYDVTASPNWSALGKRDNSKLLGFWNTMHDGSLMPSEHYELQALLGEERYFIVVIAFDNQKFITENEKEILWVTRFSMRAKGKSFKQAFPELTNTASDYFGQHVKGLKRKRADDDSQVLVGEIEVISEATDRDSKK